MSDQSDKALSEVRNLASHELEKHMRDLEEANQSLENRLKISEDRLQDTQRQLNEIIYSRKWKAVIRIDRLISRYFPYGSQRRTFLKLVYRIFLNIFKIIRFFYHRLRLFIYRYRNTIHVTNDQWDTSKPLVSIVIPCFNYGRYVAEAVSSIQQQTFKNVEIIIVDGGSNDGITPQLLKPLASEKIFIHTRSERHLVGSNRNFGISKAKGKYICCLDADDLLAPTYLEKALFFLEKYRYDVVYPGVKCFQGSNEVWPAEATSFESMTRVNAVSTVAVFSKEAWQSVGGYKDWPIGENHVPEDWDYWTRLMGSGFRFKHIPEPLMLYRVHGAGLTAHNINRLDNQRKIILKNNSHYLSPEYVNKRRSLFYNVSNPYINLSLPLSKRKKIVIFFIHNLISDSSSAITQFIKFLSRENDITLVTSFQLNPEQLERFEKSFPHLDVYHLATIATEPYEQIDLLQYIFQIRSIDLAFSFNGKLSEMGNLAKKLNPSVSIYNHCEDYLDFKKNDDSFISKAVHSFYSQNIGNNQKSFLNLSIIINFHREGTKSKNVIKNLKDIVKIHERFNLWSNIEVIAILDKSDSSTQKVVLHEKAFFSSIHNVEYGDLAEARNAGVERAKNNFVLFCDADDYSSLNCLIELFRAVQSHYLNIANSQLEFDRLDPYKHIAVFPKRLIEFPNLFLQLYNESNVYVTENMRFLHMYNSKILCPTHILRELRFRPNESRYGSEDWDLNNRLLHSGIKFAVADYVLYYRRIAGHGLNLNQFIQKKTVRNSELYSCKIDFEKQLSIPRDPFFLHTEESLFNYHKNFIRRYDRFLKFNIKSMRAGTFDQFRYETTTETKIFQSILHFIGSSELLIFSPWVIVGGADKLIIEHSKVLKDAQIQSCLITTIKSGVWISKVEIPHLDLREMFEAWDHLGLDMQLHILLKAVVNSKLRYIHIIQSDLAFKLSKYYGHILKEHNIELIVSLYNPAFDETTQRYYGYPVDYPEAMINAKAVLSDNNFWYKKYREWAGQDFNYKKLYTPVDLVSNTKNKATSFKRVLWASRISEQKLIDVLYEVCLTMPHIEFVLYGSTPEDEKSKLYFEKIMTLKNIDFKGTYNDLSEIPLDQCDLFLFTSKFEGLAIVRLDMINHNVPIVTSDVGDSTEIFGDDYELLVKDVWNPKEYCQKIDLYYKNPDFYFEKTKKIRASIRDRHNYSTFKAGYLGVFKEDISINLKYPN